MKEMNNIKEVFDIFVDSCEKAGVKFGKEEEKQVVEEWPKTGDKVWTKDRYGCLCDFTWGIGSPVIPFKTHKECKKYYSIIDTINDIVDGLGRPWWSEFEDSDKELSAVYFCFDKNHFCNGLYSTMYSQNTFFPYCKKPYLNTLLVKVSEEDLLCAFKYSMGFRG